MIAYDTDLNPEQKAAAMAPDGPILVLAAAGTGKTRTLVYRVAYLVEEKGIDPERILLLTFTNRAAREMLDRARSLVQTNVSGLWGGTFHHMANRILRRHAAVVGYPDTYTILDREDTLSLLRTCVKEGRFPDSEFPKAEVLADVISTAMNSAGSVADVAAARFSGHDALIDVADIVRVAEAYRARKQAIGAMDFDDLLTNGLRLFQEHADLLERYQERFLHILVDEYQDTNPIQAEWVDRLAVRRRNLLVVGDDFQSIYARRGADYRHILSFPKRYEETRVYLLETNYRSVPEILAVANACIAGNPNQFQKTLRSTREAHRKPFAVRVFDAGQQARYVVERIRALRREAYRWSDIAVLYRAHYHAMELQMELTREGIPFAITSGARFFEQAHVKDVCALLRVVQSPTDEPAFLRLLALLPKVGEKTAARLWGTLGRRFRAQAPADCARVRESLPPAARAAWDRIEALLAAVEEEDLRHKPAEMIHRFVQSFYDGYAVSTFDNGERRLEDLQGLVEFTARFESLEQFLSEVALLTNLDAEVENGLDVTSGVVRLSTVHQAKGLEWPAVFVLWMSEGMFPSARAVAGSPEGEAEERRLFYVAVTRARDELVLVVPGVRRGKDGGLIPTVPSRFLRDVPPDMVEEVRLW